MCYKVFLSFFSKAFIFEMFRYTELYSIIKPFLVDVPIYFNVFNSWHKVN